MIILQARLLIASSVQSGQAWRLREVLSIGAACEKALDEPPTPNEGAGMPNYLVRIRENREAVGIFAVEDLDELLYWIDEVTDPSDCEYALIGSGSIIWEGPAIAVPAPDHDWDSERRPVLNVIGRHELGGTWMQSLLDDDLVFEPCADIPLPAANDH